MTENRKNDIAERFAVDAPQIEELRTKVNGAWLLVDGLLFAINHEGMPNDLEDAQMVILEMFDGILKQIDEYSERLEKDRREQDEDPHGFRAVEDRLIQEVEDVHLENEEDLTSEEWYALCHINEKAKAIYTAYQLGNKRARKQM